MSGMDVGIVAALILIGLLLAGWLAWSRYKLHAFRRADAQMKHGRRLR
jgi:predicted negative regulator of RcsB-dependent stress response